MSHWNSASTLLSVSTIQATATIHDLFSIVYCFRGRETLADTVRNWLRLQKLRASLTRPRKPKKKQPKSTTFLPTEAAFLTIWCLTPSTSAFFLSALHISIRSLRFRISSSSRLCSASWKSNQNKHGRFFLFFYFIDYKAWGRTLYKPMYKNMQNMYKNFCKAHSPF